MGHRLVKKYPHKCKNSHGHEYLAEIEIGSKELDEYDFVIDFAVIKDKVKKWIDDEWDHGFLCSELDTVMIDFLKATGQKVATVKENPTAEIIAKTLFEKVEELIGCTTKITVWETPDSYAIYEG